MAKTAMSRFAIYLPNLGKCLRKVVFDQYFEEHIMTTKRENTFHLTKYICFYHFLHVLEQSDPVYIFSLQIKKPGEKGGATCLLSSLPLSFSNNTWKTISEFVLYVSLSSCFDLWSRRQKCHHSPIPDLLEVWLLALCWNPDPPSLGDHSRTL